MAYEPFSKSQKQHSHLFWVVIKMDDRNVLFSFIFIQIDINCKSKLHMEL
jgi:hypothetical protein